MEGTGMEKVGMDWEGKRGGGWNWREQGCRRTRGVNGGKEIGRMGREDTYRTFLGLMIKHHLVQIIPVAVRATFCVKESFSTGRAKSDMPARTSAHYAYCQHTIYSSVILRALGGGAREPQIWRSL